MKKIIVLLLAMTVLFSANAQKTVLNLDTVKIKKDTLQSDAQLSVPLNTPEKEAVYVSTSKKDNEKIPHSVTSKIVDGDANEMSVLKLSEKNPEKLQAVAVKEEYAFTPEEQKIIDAKKQLLTDKSLSAKAQAYEEQIIMQSSPGTGNTQSNPIVAGSFGASFSCTNSQNTNNFTNNYTGRPTNDVFYKFTLTKAMTVVINHCGSEISDTYLHLLNSSGTLIVSNDDYSGEGRCSNTTLHSYIIRSLAAGTYYVVSEGYSSNGVINTTISGATITGDVFGVPIVAGSFGANFNYSNSQNTNNFTHQYIRPSDLGTKDVFYKFTITTYMSVIMKHCGSSLSDTYLYLLNSSGLPVDPSSYNDDYIGEGQCSSSLHSYLKKNLPPGTYYVVSEGYSQNGVIVTQISGTILPVGDAMINPINAGTYSDNFQYSNTQNTANFHDEYHYSSKSYKMTDVFHKFTISKKMIVTMTHCGSALSDTYMILLDANGNLISLNDDNGVANACSNALHSSMKKELNAGTYYVVSEGYSQNGSITLNITGHLNEFNYPQSSVANINISGGSATAVIPIEVPSGVNGILPNADLVYNSRSGFGLAGYGWTVSGLSAITVTGKTLYHDNTITPPASGGPYVLDGQRMIADGSNFTLENNRSVSIRSSGTGYVAYYPDGSKATYSAYISGYMWRITRFETLQGNYITYTYSGINIDQIEYGGNSGKSSSHFASVKFTYESNPDANMYFLGGSELKYAQRIKEIKTYVSSSVFRTYKLSYNNEYYKQLNRVDIAAGNETLQPVIVSYGYNTSPSYNLKETDVWNSYYKDANHRNAHIYSGKICDWENSNQIVVLQKKSSYASTDKILIYEGIDAYSSVASSIQMEVGANFKQLFVANVDETPEDEIVKISQTGVQFSVDVYTMSIYSTGVVKKVTRSGSGTNDKTKFLLGDFKGKGRQILFRVNPQSSSVTLRDLTEAMEVSVSISGFTYNDGDILFTMDYDGDGKTDLAHINSSGLNIYTVSATSNSWSKIASTTSINKSTFDVVGIYVSFLNYYQRVLLLGDINGDGKTDILISPLCAKSPNDSHFYFNESGWKQLISIGNGSFKETIDNQFIWLSNNAIVTDVIGINTEGGSFLQDMNGDGKADLVTMELNKICIFYSTGAGFSNEKYKRIYSTGEGLLTTISCLSPNNNNFLAYVRENKIQCMNFSRSEQKEALLTKMGNTQVDYDRIDMSGKNGKYFYTPGYGAALPYRNLKYEPLYVVTNVKTSLGSTVISNNDYTYTNAVIHLQGLGFCGFESIGIYDRLRGQTVTQTYEPYRFGLPKQTESPTQTSENTWTVSTTSTYPKSSNITLTKQKTTDKLTGNIAEIAFLYNSYGMPTKRTVTKGSMTETISNAYKTNVSGTNWIILPETETVVQTYNGTTVNKVIDIAYNAKYKPSKITVKTGPGKDKTVTEEDFVYDEFGNVTESSLKRYGSADVLTNKYTYSTNGRFMLTTTNEMGQTTTYQYSDLLGMPLTSKDFKSNTTSYQYNGFGKLTKTTFPDGVVREESLSGQFSTGTTTSPKLTVTETGSPKQESLYDVFMRETSRGIQGFDGSMTYSTIEYNSKGEVYRISEPGSTSRFMTYTYDGYGRQTGVTAPSGKATTYSYSGKATTVSEHGFTKTTTLNGEGFIDKITDAAGEIKYSYRPDGQPKSITAPDGSITSFEYDDYGRQKSITDPSAGLIQYEYDGNGYTNKQTDAEGRITSTLYNKYGQPTSSTVKKGSTTELSTSYGYNSYYQLTSVSAGGTSIVYTYDNLLRTATRTETVGGSSIKETYNYTSGRPTKVTYSGLSGTQPPVTEYIYENNYLRKIKSGSIDIKTINSKNKFGQTTQYTLGNGVVETRAINANGLLSQSKAVKGSTVIQDFGYSIDPLKGVLDNRKDNTRNITETFQYDSQRRLTNYTRNGQTAASVAYSSMGNIDSKTDAGTLEYNVPGKPYAIGKQTGNPGSVPARVQDITYTGFQRPSTIEENGYKVTLTYGPDYGRNKMEVRNNNSLQYTRYYLGGNYEKDVPASGSTTERLYVGGSAYNAPAVYIRTGSGAWTLHYIHRDHLGSITAITNTDGSKIAEYSFDPWGRQRNPANQQAYGPDVAPSLLLGRGYTGHEHLPMFGLVNMNARLYDPVLGRFLSPDPYVQAPDWSQSFNRYSYCVNNPLMYIDQDGEVLHLLVGGIIGGAINWISHGCKFNAQGASYFGTGFVAGALTAAFPVAAPWIAGGLGATNSIMQQGYTNGWNNIDYGQALFDGVKGGVTSYIGGQFSDYLSGTGVGNWIENIESPLLRNFIGAEMVGVPFGAVVGGLSEYSNGGDFWNGAWEGTKSGFVSSGISAIGASVQYSLEYKANLFTGKSNDFFEGTEYSPKVLRQMNEDSFHGFPESVTAFQQDGYITHIKGGDGIIRSQLNIPGYYKGYHGEFQFMKGSDGIINHRFFQPYK